MKKIILFVLISIVYITIQAQPANNACANAITLTPGVTCVATTGPNTSTATDENMTGDCTAGTENSVWYQFVATATSHTVTVDGASNMDAVIGALTTCGVNTRPTGGTCTDATLGDGIETLNLTGLTIGTTYRIQVHDWNADGGDFTICVQSPVPPPANDNCAGATAFPIIPTTGTCVTLSNQSTAGATNSGVTPTGTCTSNATTPSNDVWFSFVASATTHYLEATWVSGATDIYFQVFSSTCAASMTSIYCSDADAGGTLSGLTIGNTYRIRMFTWTSGLTTVQNLCLRSPLPPLTNDNCIGALPLTVNPTATLTTTSSFNTNGATQSQVGCSGTADDDVWFYFDATATSHNFGVTSSISTDLMHQVFSGTCAGTLTSLICSDPNASTGECFVPGQRYFVRVYTYSNASSSGTVTLGVGTPLSVTDGSCKTSTQICAPFSFTAGINQPNGGAGCGANYGCLITTPNPEYHWIQVIGSGNINLGVTGTAVTDIDFAAWGPFTSPPNPNPSTCTSSAGSLPTACGSALGAPVSCDYTSANGGSLTYTGATTGQYFLILITNFANTANTINVVANAGNTATIGCPCIIGDVTATPGTCNASTNLYTVTGAVTYTNAPTSGTLTVSDNAGNSQVFTYPFGASPLAYSIPNNISNGVSHNVTAQFSAATQCGRCVSYTAPAACCTAPTPSAINIVDAGCGYTYDLSATGGGGGPYEWSTSSTFGTILTTTTGIVMPFGTSTTTYYVRKVGQTCGSSLVVTDATPPSGTITSGNCATCSVLDGSTRTFYDASNNIIVSLTDPSGSTNLGTTTACATVEASDITHNGQDYMRRHFDIDVTNNGPATVTLYLSAADVSNLISASADDAAGGYGVFTGMADLCITSYDGLAETPASHTSSNTFLHSALTIVGPIAPDGHYTVTFPVSGFSGFFCHACNPNNNPLPVEFISFDGYHSNNVNNLRWATASEINNHKFEVQRSIDASNWEYIGEVDGNGNSSVRNSYSFIDNKLNTNAYYYRLKQIDFDSKYEYSNVIYLSNSSVSINNMYPNPAQNNIFYSLASDIDKSVIVNIINIDGKIISTKNNQIFKGANNLMSDISDLPSGVYILQVIDNSNGERIQNTFIKE
jgi:hypothetical protein